MKKKYIIVRFLFIALIFNLVSPLAFSQEKKTSETYSRINLNTPSKSTLTQLDNLGIDLTCGAVQTNDGIQLELSNRELVELKKLGLGYTVLINDLTKYYSERAQRNLPLAISQLNSQKSSAAKSGFGKSSTSSVVLDNIGQYNGCDEINWSTPSNFKLGSMGGCFTVTEALAELDLMRSLYPNLISVKTDASPSNQTTLEGRTTYYVRISDNPDIDEAGEPETLYTGMTHSREVSSLMNLMYYMWYILENYGSDSAITNLVDNQALYFIPIVNSDGLAYNEFILPNGGGMQRKNRRDTGACGTTSDGIDLNRNFGYYWGNGGSSTSGCNETYRGATYFSEPETQIIRDFFLDHDFKLILNHHSYKNAMLHGYAGVNPADLDAAGVDRHEDEFAKYNHDMTHFNRYAYGPSTQISGLNSGNTNDWMMGPTVAGPTGGPGSGKDAMAWTPENGAQINEGGFWPNPLIIDDIARRALRPNFLAAYYSGKYAKLIDLTPSNISTLSGNFDFGIEFLGQTPSDFTVTVTPIGNITSSIDSATETGMATLEQRPVSIPYTLNGSIQPNDAIEFKVSLSNDDGILYEANIIKYYNPTLLFQDDEETNGISNWTPSGGSWGTTTDTYSGTVAITDSPSASYSNNESKTLQLTNPISTASLVQTVIQYYAKWDLERSFDYVQIEASTNGSTWTPLCGTYTKPGAPDVNNTYSGKGNSGSANNNFQPDNEQLYDGDTQDKWVMEEIVIDTSENSSFYNQATVYLRFNFNTDSTNSQDSYTTTFDGFVFDDFKIITNTTNIPQTITFNALADKYTTDVPFQVSASATSGLPVSFSIVSGPATISGDTVTLTGSTGTVIVRASQAGDATYNAATDVDQSFNVLTAPCLSAPTGLIASSIGASSATLNWDTVGGATYNYRYRKFGTTIWTTISTSNISEIISGLDASTQYDVEVSSVCPDTSISSYSSTYNFTTTALTYCASNGSTANSTGATQVVFIDINNSDPNNTDNAYEDFTTISTDVIKGTSHQLTVSVDTDGNKTVYAFAWIDFNRDGTFNTTDEQFDLGSVKNGTSLSPVSTTINIPSGASTGVARMRIAVKFNADPTSCETGFNGEVEDYSINIIEPCLDLDGDGFTTCDGDCDDSLATGASIYPGATEICDGIDNNCDGNIDEGLSTTTYYLDADNDTFGDAGNSVTTCDGAPAGYVTNDTDCDDTNNSIYPGATEIPDNGIDEDCDGFDDNTLSSKDFDIKNVTIKPNPFQNSITINVPLVYNNSNFDIKIFDLNGRLVFNKVYSSVNNRVLINNLDNLDQATYLIKITNIENGISVIKKLVKF